MGPLVAQRRQAEVRLLCSQLQQSSVPRQCEFIRHLTFSISPPRHMHTHVHIWDCSIHKYKHTSMRPDTQAGMHASMYACMHTHAGIHRSPPKPRLFLRPSKTITVINSTRKETTHWFITDDITHPGEFCKMAISLLWKGWAGVFSDHRQPWSLQQFRCGQLVLTSTYLAKDCSQDFWFLSSNWYFIAIVLSEFGSGRWQMII